MEVRAATFGDNVDFLRRHTQTVVLSSKDGAARVAICPALQGRVAVSTAGGESGPSFGWINRALIASGKLVPHMNVYGGADRFWLGPEGGQFSLFFPPGAPQDLAHWQTPAPIDAEPFTLVENAADRALMRKTMRLTNASGTTFDIAVEREVRLLFADPPAARPPWPFARRLRRRRLRDAEPSHQRGRRSLAPRDRAHLDLDRRDVRAVAATTIVLPLRPGAGPAVGKVGQRSLLRPRTAGSSGWTERAVYFRADGQQRGKIGVSPLRARRVIGSYDGDSRVFTTVDYTLPEDAGARGYVNSLWEHQADPYAGDAVNAYNDGPATPGAAPFGPFYELETSSPALALAPGESAEHIHRTVHLAGSPGGLDRMARDSLGVGIDEITAALPGPASGAGA